MQEATLAYHCEIRAQSAQPALSIRARAAVQDLPPVLGKAFAAIDAYLRQMGEKPAGPPFVAYYNMDMQDLDLEIGCPVARRLAGRGEIQPSEIPAATVATCTHVGPYTALRPAYEALTAWVNERGYEMSGVVYEMYLNDPQHTPPEALQTQIVYLLRG